MKNLKCLLGFHGSKFNANFTFLRVIGVNEIYQNVIGDFICNCPNCGTSLGTIQISATYADYSTKKTKEDAIKYLKNIKNLKGV